MYTLFTREISACRSVLTRGLFSPGSSFIVLVHSWLDLSFGRHTLLEKEEEREDGWKERSSRSEQSKEHKELDYKTEE